jgi:hypothetical protein
VGTSYFDAVSVALSGGASSTTAMAGSTEVAQFLAPEAGPRPARRAGLAKSKANRR